MVPCWLVGCVCIQNVMHMLMTWEVTCTGYQVTKERLIVSMRLLGTIRYTLGTLFQYSKNYDDRNPIGHGDFWISQLSLLHIGFKIVYLLFHLRHVALSEIRGLLCHLFTL
jgi:hypothetical protein